VIPRYYLVAESEHELQNPTSEEKLLLLGTRLGLGPESRALDVASGRGGPALVLARTFGCAIEGIEIEPEFAHAAVARAEEQGLSELLSFRVEDASSAELPPETYDAALCLGATFVYGGLPETVSRLAPAVKPGGHVAVGEIFWRTLPLPEEYEDRSLPLTTLEGTARMFETEGLPVVSVIESSVDDWDRYETLHWQSVERWLAENAEDPDAADIRERFERQKWKYLRHQRELMGWAIFVGWKRPG
jgi:cyclopropane fatty-acyl-phospholipid synthase-like methyltransferase